MSMYDQMNQPAPENDASTTNKLMSSVMNQNNTDASVIQLRLSTDPILEKIQLFLEGKQKVVLFDENTGTKQVRYEQVGNPIANKQGIHALMFRISSIVSVPVVQGNFKEDWYRNYCGNVRQSLNDTIMLNQHEWEISDAEYEHCIDGMMEVIEAYMTRTIDNKERESLGQSATYVERAGEAQSNNQGLFSFLRR